MRRHAGSDQAAAISSGKRRAAVGDQDRSDSGLGFVEEQADHSARDARAATGSAANGAPRV